MQQPKTNFGNGGGINTRVININCYYDNPNYCSSCGSHVKDDHTSIACTTPGPNHNCNTTRLS